MLYLLQFASLTNMLVSAFFIAVTRLHVRWTNRRYEYSRWMIFSALLLMAAHFFLQMHYGFRATSPYLGAVVNILVYQPCFTLFAIAIYNIEVLPPYRRQMGIVCAGAYVAILAVFAAGFNLTNSISSMGVWLYVMLGIFFANMVYCIYMIVWQMTKRKLFLETMTATDMQPFIRYSRASILMLLLTAITIPFAILSTKVLYVVGPLGQLILLFFIVNFVAFGYNYVPTEELLDNDVPTRSEQFSSERAAFIQRALDKWCADLGYKDGSVNMLTLSRSLGVSKHELTQYFSRSQNTTFRTWLSEIRFNAAKRMMMEYPDYSNDIISSECGFSSRSYLYRMFKEKEGCTPMVWREK